MGTDHQMPTTPKNGMADSAYARATLVPRDRIVRMTDMPGLPRARYSP